MITDAPYQLPAGSPGAKHRGRTNDGDANQLSSESFPSESQVQKAIVKNSIIPVFAVTASYIPTYVSY